VRVERVMSIGYSESAHDAATGLVLGTPLSAQIAERGASGDAIRDHAAAALAREYGDGMITAPLAALVVTARA
jgi:hypothetical protein